jgi:hypothetical protein
MTGVVEEPKVLPLPVAYWVIKVEGALVDLIPIVIIVGELELVVSNLLRSCTKTCPNFNNGLVGSGCNPRKRSLSRLSSHWWRSLCTARLAHYQWQWALQVNGAVLDDQGTTTMIDNNSF